MKKSVVAMVLVGGRGSRLESITKHTAKPAVSFGGKYKLIDFVLSNVSNSSIDTLGIITQYEPHELMNYIQHGSTWDLDVSDGGVQFLTPFTTSDGIKWQKGTADAIIQHYKFIEHYNADYVLILSGDHIYKMDYSKLIDYHIKKNADITISAYTEEKEASRFGIIEHDEDGLVTGFKEKPSKPKTSNASMGIYVFKRKVLKDLLTNSSNKGIDFGHDIIPLSFKENYKTYMYAFKGYFRDVGTINSLFEANMDLLDNPQYLNLYQYDGFPVYTRSSELPPHHIVSSELLENSIISDGCIISGSVIHSILSSGVIVDEGSKISNSIIYSNAIIKKNVQLENAIVLEKLIIKENSKFIFSSPTVIDEEILKKGSVIDG